MKIALVSIDTKFIHTNMAIRYLQANCTAPTVLFEFTIKDSDSHITAVLAEARPDLIGFSCYLWNIRRVEALARSLKALWNPMIVIGGPEVSFEPEHFLENPAFDYLIAGEGEIAFDRLIQTLESGKDLSSVPNLAWRNHGTVVQNPVVPILDLDALRNPYRLTDLGDVAHRIQYLELSRGCPFHCSYCLASLDNRVRTFSLSRIQEDLRHVMDQGGKTFKFLDRTFNLRPESAMEVFRYLIDAHREGTVFQFEITGDLLPESVISFINTHAPKGLFRFEIGIQSTNPTANRAVERHQDLGKLMKNIRLIQEGGVIDLHLDLIAGLPQEDRVSFARTFDEVFALRPKELQLGFLKLLRGTPLRRDAEKYGIVYNEEPPYEIRKTRWLSEADLEEIHGVEAALDLFWNKGFFPISMGLLLKGNSSPFALFFDLWRYMTAQGHSFHRYGYADVFSWLANFAKERFPDQYPDLFDSLKYEYLASCKIKSKIWWDHREIMTQRRSILRAFQTRNPEISLDLLYKHALVTEYQGGYLIVLYLPDGPSLYQFN
jgi:radical SAM superfamily enzyme YgiQ (UPF0313 family)